jgi:hypothetical protein
MRHKMNAERAASEEEAARHQPKAAERLGSLLEGAVVLSPAVIASLVANPGTADVTQAAQMLASLPPEFRRLAMQPEKAAALFIALALDHSPEVRERQLAFVFAQVGGDFHDEMKEVLAYADALTAVQRMPALLQVFSALHQLGRKERIELLKLLNGLLVREGRVSPFAYALRKLAQVQLQDDLDPRRRIVGQQTLQGARAELQVLFSALAAHGSEDETEARRAYEAGMSELLPRARPAFTPLGHWAPRLDHALSRLDSLQPAAKEMLVKALVRTISHDLRMTVAESELLRAICAVLHCPLPALYKVSG